MLTLLVFFGGIAYVAWYKKNVLDKVCYGLLVRVRIFDRLYADGACVRKGVRPSPRARRQSTQAARCGGRLRTLDTACPAPGAVLDRPHSARP